MTATPRPRSSTRPPAISSPWAALVATWPRRKGALLTPLFASLTLGLAPFVPHAHVWKQLVNLWYGRLTAPIDIFDLVLHGAPWVWLIAALAGWLGEAARLRRGQADALPGTPEG